MDSSSDLNNISSPTRYSLTPRERERDRDRDGSNTVVKDVPRYVRTCGVNTVGNISIHKRNLFECDLHSRMFLCRRKNVFIVLLCSSEYSVMLDE